MYLVVLESPTKTRALQKFLGDKYHVVSCNGHIFQMTKAGRYKLGIDWEQFLPLYEIEPSKKGLIKSLKKIAKQAKTIYLATDPDREGEAIAHHLSSSLINNKAPHYRVLFNEITQSAVLEAFKNPKTIDLNLVASQSTRRVLDRMIGFRLSKLLQQKLFAKSAGRVQSVGLHLLSKQERKIIDFKPITYWELHFNYFDYQFHLKKLSDHTLPIQSYETIQKLQTLLKQHPLELVSDQKRVKPTFPPTFLTTAKLLQFAAQKLGFSVKKTTFLAQKLYEGISVDNQLIGFITYPRTDSTRINQQFFQASQVFLSKLFPDHQIDQIKNQQNQKSSQNVQNAHEAIRITNWAFNPNAAQKYLERDEHKLYTLIYKHTQMPFLKPMQSQIQTTKIKINDAIFEARKEIVIDPGFQTVNGIEVSRFKTIAWKQQSLNQPIKIIETKKTTQPPQTLSEGDLIKAMELNGVGRPSTYGQMIAKLLNSLYVEKQKTKLRVKKKGLEVDNFLQIHFPEIINAKYTANLEQKLDEITNNASIRKQFLQSFWNQFNDKIQAKQKSTTKLAPKPLDQTCPLCKSKLVLRESRFGTFISCSEYPKCKFKQTNSPTEKQLLDQLCPQCQHQLQKRSGKYGNFIGCSNYPHCRYIVPKNSIKSPVELLEQKCLKCKNPLAKRKGRFGEFISCSQYPKCRYRPKTQFSTPKSTKKTT